MSGSAMKKLRKGVRASALAGRMRRVGWRKLKRAWYRREVRNWQQAAEFCQELAREDARRLVAQMTQEQREELREKLSQPE